MCITFSWAVLFLYNAELFPTEIRTSGIGSASFVGRLGGMLAPWVAVLGQADIGEKYSALGGGSL